MPLSKPYLIRVAHLATDAGHGSERAPGGVRFLGMVAEIEARMELTSPCFPSSPVYDPTLLRLPGFPYGERFRIISGVDNFVAVKAPRNHKVQQGLAVSR